MEQFFADGGLAIEENVSITLDGDAGKRALNAGLCGDVEGGVEGHIVIESHETVGVPGNDFAVGLKSDWRCAAITELKRRVGFGARITADQRSRVLVC